MLKRTLAGVALSAAATTAFADGQLDIRYAMGDYEADAGANGTVETDSDGFDLRAVIKPGDAMIFRVEILQTSTDELDTNAGTVNVTSDVSATRLGLGYEGSAGGLVPYGIVEYGRIRADATGFGSDGDSGVILTGGIKDDGTGKFIWGVELGYLKYTDSDGFVGDIEVGYRFTELLAFVAGYQHYDIEADDFSYGGFRGNIDLEVPTLSAGIRFQFGT